MNKPNIRFISNLIPLIESGEKVLTYRKGAKYSTLEVGDKIYFIDSGTNMEVGRIKILEKYHTTFKELPFNIKGHEVYESKEHQKQVFEGYYGNMSDEEKMLVLRFELIK